MKGASARRASRRAISVLPTPVGPIIRMFFGVISWRSGSATCWRRQRFRSAIATERFARPWPTMYLSSSCTISCGVMPPMGAASSLLKGNISLEKSFQHFDGALVVRVDADVGGDRERLVHDLSWRLFRILQQGARRGLRIRPARADGDEAELRLEHVAQAGDDQRALLVGDGEHRLQASQHAVGAPVLGELDRGAHQVALVLVELALEALEERESVRGAAGEAGENLVVIEPADLLRAAFHDHVAERHLAVAAQRHAGAAANGKNGSAVELFHLN